MSEPATVKDIVIAYLKEHGYDGLANDGCCCWLDDIALCGCLGKECVPGHTGFVLPDESTSWRPTMSERDLIKDLLEQLVMEGADELRDALKLWQQKRRLDLVIRTLTQDQMAVLRIALIDSAKDANKATAQRNRTIQAILDELVDRVIDAGVASLMGAIK